MPSQTIENYLKTIYLARDDDGSITVSQLSTAIGVSVPTVNSMVKKLQKEGYITYQKYKPVSLTAKGDLTASLIIRKHRLTEMYLVKMMFFGWEEVHEIAEQVEHIQSPAFFDRMDELLGHPVIDPHGSPIPDKNGKIHIQHFKKLADIPLGQPVQLQALANSDDQFLVYLNKKGIRLGSTMTIASREPFDLSIKIRVNDSLEDISHEVSEWLLVE